jgi:hypothetical protein
MMNITITAETPEELREKLVRIAKFFGHDSSQLELNPQVVTENTVDVGHVPLPEPEKPVLSVVKPKTTRRKSQPKAEEKPIETDDESLPVEQSLDEPVQLEMIQKVTKQEVESALRNLVADSSVEAATKVLSQFGAKRLSEIKEDDYAALLAACRSAIKK